MPRNDAYKPEQSNVALWPNDRKQRDSDPDLTGTAQIIDEETGEITEYWANAWENDPGGKRPAISIKLKKKEAPRQHAASRRHEPATTGKRYGTRQRPSNMETWETKYGGKDKGAENPPHDFEDEIPF